MGGVAGGRIQLQFAWLAPSAVRAILNQLGVAAAQLPYHVVAVAGTLSLQFASGALPEAGVRAFRGEQFERVNGCWLACLPSAAPMVPGA